VTKQELLSDLQTQRETIITALNFSYIVGSRVWEREFKTLSISQATMDIAMDSSHYQYVILRPADLVAVYDNRAINNATFALIRMTIRTVLTESYEKIQAFCLGNGMRQPKWEAAAWRPLARLARNSFSHDFKLNFLDPKTGKLRSDVKFQFPDGRVVEIKTTEHGQPITGNNMPIDVVFGLLDVMRNFVTTAL
jgi:hypothetical protein